MENPPVRLPEELLEATEVLSQNLLVAEPFVLFDRAQTRLKEDNFASSLLEQLSSLQAQIRSKQVEGSVTQKDVDELRAVQGKVQQNAAIMEYARTQLAAINCLREISQLLGMDFAALARQSSC